MAVHDAKKLFYFHYLNTAESHFYLFAAIDPVKRKRREKEKC